MISTSPMPEWPEVRVRHLEDAERPYEVGDKCLPIAIEPRESVATMTALQFAQHRSAELMQLIAEHGAILLRGFQISDEKTFESVIMAIDGVRPMSTYFMSETGRDRVEGTEAVFNTNTFIRTGGGFHIGGFHSENFYTTDVPGLQSFWCKAEPWLGGETALVQSSKVFDELPAKLRQKFLCRRVLSRVFSTREIGERYNISETIVVSICKEVGLEIVDSPQGRLVPVMKPLVYRRTPDNKLSLQLNFSGELAGLDDALQQLIVPLYTGKRWLLHRFAWRFRRVRTALSDIQALLDILARPTSALKFLCMLFISDRPQVLTLDPDVWPSIGTTITAEEIKILAQAIWKHTSVFTWQRGDIVVFDNTQMLHAGMPGLGKRELRVMMCNPIPFQFPISGGIYDVPPNDQSYVSLATQIEQRRYSSV
jgi:alpha-ketoglutarate-dependent taurine dioxygenase